MKKMISMAMAAVMALTLVVAVAPAKEVKAAPTTQDATVSYTSDSTIQNANYTITVPSGIAFSDTVRENVDATVKMEAVGNGTVGKTQVEIKVASAEGYKMVNDATTDELKYTLTYKSALAKVANTPEVIGVLGQDEIDSVPVDDVDGMSITGKAAMDDKTYVPQATSGYADTLTYTITEIMDYAGTDLTTP